MRSMQLFLESLCRRGRRSCGGFTIIEMMVGITLASIAAAVLYSVFISTQGMYYDTRTMMESQSDSRVVMGMFTQEIRSAGSDIGEIGVQRLMVADADSIRMQSDLNGDSTLTATEPAEDVLYFYDPAAKNLVRQTGLGQMVLMDKVESFQLAYLDAQGNPVAPLPLDATDRNRVRAVQINMSVEMDDHAVHDWASTVAIRNDPVVIN